MLKYFNPFLFALVLTVILSVIFIIIGKKIPWHSRKSKRHIHKDGVLRMGGLAMVLAFNLTVLFNKDLLLTPEIYGMMIGSLVLMVVGFWDDIKEIYWKIQLFFQISVSIFVFILGLRIYYITNPWNGGIIDLNYGLGVIFSIVLVILWIVLLVNSMNWLDGIDGLSGGVSFIASASIFFLSLKSEVCQPPVAIISAIFAGASLGFLIFNFNPAKVLAGTSGAMFMGFIIAVLAIISGTKIATALLVMSVPIIDLAWVIKDRIRRGRSIFSPDRNHLHYKLMELGWSQKNTAMFYYGVTAVIAVVALNTRAIGKGITLLATIFLMVAIYFYISKKISSQKSKKQYEDKEN
jgi:UDP-GlcNAc:undecaprenyl-phosphate/decaprenyl-phosphate GlcNAc-1-phosphate transferase